MPQEWIAFYLPSTLNKCQKEYIFKLNYISFAVRISDFSESVSSDVRVDGSTSERSQLRHLVAAVNPDVADTRGSANPDLRNRREDQPFRNFDSDKISLERSVLPPTATTSDSVVQRIRDDGADSAAEFADSRSGCFGGNADSADGSEFQRLPSDAEFQRLQPDAEFQQLQSDAEF